MAVNYSTMGTTYTPSAQSGVRSLVVIIGFVITGVLAYAVYVATESDMLTAVVAGIGVLVTILITAAICVASEWERVAVLTLGKFTGMKGPGLFLVTPIFQTTPFRLDLRIVTYDVPKQSSLSRDNIPVTVDAIVYYRVSNPTDAVLKVEDYHRATRLGAQTALRDLIGKATLDELLSERERLSTILRDAIVSIVGGWGVEVSNVEIKEVVIADELMSAIAREPAAEREKRARLKLAEAEKLAAGVIYEAAQIYERDPIALQLRSMNMLYEMCMEGQSTVIFVPTETHTGMPTPLGVYGVTQALEAIQAVPKKLRTPPSRPPGAEGTPGPEPTT